MTTGKTAALRARAHSAALDLLGFGRTEPHRLAAALARPGAHFPYLHGVPPAEELGEITGQRAGRDLDAMLAGQRSATSDPGG